MTKVAIVYPTDPLGVVPGGTDTCIRDILRCAPEDIEMHLVGVTTDPATYPIGQWHLCEVGGAQFKFYPVLAVPDLERQMRIPLSLRFTLKLIGSSKLFGDIDVVQFNRIEPVLSLLGVKKPRVLIIHQNMKVISNKKSDIRWKYIPGLYFKFEDFVINRIREVFIVREDAVREYKERFVDKEDNIHFLPTWMNPNLFYRLEGAQKQSQKLDRLKAIGVSSDDKLMIFVGRLDYQKDPIYLVDSLAELAKLRTDWMMLVVGDGVLRAEVEERIAAHGLQGKVKLLGAIAQEEVAAYLRSSDLLLLSSVYEGMPRCVVEALGCGVPVVTTKAGEVTLLVQQGENGYIVEPKDPLLFASYVDKTLSQLTVFGGEPCANAVENYRADRVLSKLYATYRRLGSEV